MGCQIFLIFWMAILIVYEKKNIQWIEKTIFKIFPVVFVRDKYFLSFLLLLRKTGISRIGQQYISLDLCDLLRIIYIVSITKYRDLYISHFMAHLPVINTCFNKNYWSSGISEIGLTRSMKVLYSLNNKRIGLHSIKLDNAFRLYGHIVDTKLSRCYIHFHMEII